jgi:hypothetical protein
MTMTRTKQGKLTDYRPFQLALIGLGWLLVVLAPIVSPLPGPGGLLLFVLGFGLILKNSLWAKKQYARHSKRHPEYSDWANWALRRKRFRKRPPFPPIKRDILRLFRRDDLNSPNF